MEKEKAFIQYVVETRLKERKLVFVYKGEYGQCKELVIDITLKQYRRLKKLLK